MKLVAVLSFLFSVATAHAVEYNLKCNVADPVTSVSLSQDPRGLLSCQVDPTDKYAKLSLRSSVDVNVGGESYVIQGTVNQISAYTDCKVAMTEAERLFTARITDAATGATYTLELSNKDTIRISSMKSECVGKLQ